MSAVRVIDADLLLKKRQLRAEIAQTRLESQASLAALGAERRRLTSWRTYAQRFPWAILGVAFGAGLWLSSARSGRQLPKSLASRLIRMGLTTARSRIVADLVSAWMSRRAATGDPSSAPPFDSGIS